MSKRDPSLLQISELPVVKSVQFPIFQKRHVICQRTAWANTRGLGKLFRRTGANSSMLRPVFVTGPSARPPYSFSSGSRLSDRYQVDPGLHFSPLPGKPPPAHRLQEQVCPRPVSRMPLLTRGIYCAGASGDNFGTSRPALSTEWKKAKSLTDLHHVSQLCHQSDLN